MPYGGTLAQWVPKAHREVADYRKFLEGRLRFGGAVDSAAFDSVIVVWGGDAADHRRIDDALAEWDGQRPGRRRPRAA